jgi:eukaryotic-like serine/threonine-protein kinase
MTERYAMARRMPSANDESATFQYAAAPAGNHKQRCRVALIGGTSAHMTQEIVCLLRRRLRIAALIMVAGFGVFLVRTLVEHPSDMLFQARDKAIFAMAVAVLAAVATIVWSRIPISFRWLRVLELTLFGAAAAYFAWIQIVVYHNGRVIEWAKPDHVGSVLRLAAGSHGLRWFMLIVVYGTFIPNTWRRCALIVAILAVTPLLIMMSGCGRCPILGPHMPYALFDMVILMAVGAAIAIFGSYKISGLQQEAFEARKLGQYVLKRRLGSGGMGEVYLGEHTLLRRACAIKLIRPDQAGDPTNLSRFEREVQAMATLTHCNTVEIYDYGHAEDGTFYYVMEYLPGLSLQQLVEKYGPLPPERAVHFLRQVCGALQEAHAIGLIHRDIKPSNVIACERGGVWDVAKLLDFGLVHGLGPALRQGEERLTIQGTILGSPPYMSPEQATGKDRVDARTDIYSLGTLAYFLLTGQPPFVRDTAMEILMCHVYEPIPPLAELRPELPTDLVDVVMRCLDKDPAGRFQDAEALEQALAQCPCADLWTRRDALTWWQGHHGETTPAEPAPVGVA